LKKEGFEVVCPVDIVPDGTDWKEAMKICLAALIDCNAISPLPDIWDSKGAMLEFNIAAQLGYPVVMVEYESADDVTISDVNTKKIFQSKFN
jgi:hypothetical protein